MALNAVGLQAVQPLPSTGCSGSVIPPERLTELINVFPQEQRVILEQILKAGEIAWSAQLYSGESGIGFCFPVQDTLILLPKSATAASSLLPAQ